MRNFFYLAIFFIATSLTLALSLITFSLFSQPSFSAAKPAPPETSFLSALEAPRYGMQVFAALASETGEVSGVVSAADARVEIIRQYLEAYNSPLLPFAQNLVAAADKYGLDFRLLVAIAQQESNLCKKAPAGSFNCWGWGIHSSGTLGFSGYEAAIGEVAKGLKEEYIDKGFVTPEAIMGKYAPLSLGTWAAGILQFMAEME